MNKNWQDANPSERDTGIVSRGKSTSASNRGYTPIQLLFELRLKSLIEKKRLHEGTLPPSDWRIRLIDKALYSTYNDCLHVGLGENAQTLIRQARQHRFGK